MIKINKCIRVPNGIMTISPDSEFSNSEIESKRKALARQWRCPLDTIADFEAIDILRREQAAKEKE